MGWHDHHTKNTSPSFLCHTLVSWLGNAGEDPPHSSISTMSNKRTKNNEGWYTPLNDLFAPEPGVPVLPPRPSTGSIATDVALGVLDTWYYQEAQAWQRVAGERQIQIETLQNHVVTSTQDALRANQSATRRGTLLGIANDQIASLRREVDFKTALIAEIFERFPEVCHEYEWAYSDEVLGQHFQDGEETEMEELDEE